MKRTARNILLFLVVFSQLLFGVFAPTFVVCQEESGVQVLELSLFNCCTVDAAPAEGAEQVRPQDDCGDCEDAALVVSLKDVEASPQLALRSAAFLIDSPAWSWDACAPPLPARTPNAWPEQELKALRAINLRC